MMAENRWIKCSCPSCGYGVRTSKKWLRVSPPLCPTCTTGVTVVMMLPEIDLLILLNEYEFIGAAP